VKLLLRPPILHNEGPYGYLLRLRRANLLSYKELRDREIVSAKSRLGGLPALIGSGLNVDDWRVRFEGANVRWNQVFPRACPLCLAEQSHWRVWWELEFYDTCHIHQIDLVDTCHCCGESFSWNRDSLMECQCGASIIEHPKKSAPDALVELSRRIADKWQDSTESPADWFTRLSLLEFQQLIHFLGAYAAFLGNKRPQKITKIKNLGISWKLTSIVAEIIQQWPQGFHRFLNQLQDGKSDTAARLPTRFGHFYQALYRQLIGVSFDPLRDEFQRYLMEHWNAPLAKRNRRLPMASPREQKWMLAAEAERDLGISRQRLKLLIAENQVKACEHRGKSGRVTLMVNRVDIEQVGPRVKSEVNLKTAMRILGLNRRRLENICTMLFPEAIKLNGGASWCIPAESIERILNIREGLTERPYVNLSEVAVRDVLQYWQWSDNVIVALIHAVKDRELLPVALLEGFEGISSWIFDRERLSKWGEKYRPKRLGLSVPEAAQHLRVKQEVAYFWVRSGILTKVDKDNTGAIISINSIKEFESSYLLAAQLAYECGTSPGGLIRRLSEFNVTPCSGPTVDGCRQALFRRDSLLKNVAQRLYPEARLRCLETVSLQPASN